MTGRLRRRGATSLMNRAIPMLSGTANTRAMIEVTTVPKMKLRAPNLFSLGAHRLVKRNSAPFSLKMGQASRPVE